MAKLKAPLLSFLATGNLAKILAFRRRGKTTVAESYPFPMDRKSTEQLTWRTVFQMAVEWWHQLSPAEHLEWEALARPRHMTGYALFLSTALKPNPGIYLPLIGGAMKGDIDMAGHAFNGFYTSPEQTFARIYLSTPQTIPANTWTKVLLDLVHFDIQGEADLANNHIVVKTTNRRFIFGQAQFVAISVIPGHRFGIGIQLNGDWVSSAFYHSSKSATMSVLTSSPMLLSSDDIIDMWVHHDMDSDIDIIDGLWPTWLAVY